jgi:ATP-dependent RNA helicase SUPV3L1/SUV3
MSKKNKKNSKINQRIRKFFDDDPFDVGIERVSSETLSELFHTLGIYDIEYDKESLVKFARMLWSEADSGFRRDVLDFFTANGKVYPSTTPKTPNLDKEAKLDSILEELDVSNDEAILLHQFYADVRSKKITIEKVESRLRHIRFEMKKQRLQKALDGVFDIYDSLEFNASIHYFVFAESFYKILTLNTKHYTYEYLNENDEEQIIEDIQKEKQRVIEKKQAEVDKFLKSLSETHRYLDKKYIVSALRASPPKSKLSYPHIKTSVLKHILSKVLGEIGLKLHDEEVLVYVKESLTLPHSKIVQDYDLELHVELNSLLEEIWNERELDFSEILAEAKAEKERQFLEELKSIANECSTYATLLHLNDEELYKRVYDILLDFLPHSLDITPKIARKTIRRFVKATHAEVIKKQRHALLARTIRDFKNLFPQARAMKRKLILHIGPTNSGKTYEAMQKLQDADTGYYLAPLRLLALEGYETLKEQGLDASLITGEEQIINDDATHISSTIEMLNFEVDVDVCVIDEVQMIDDRDRGWAWANAIIGVAASEVIMTGSPNSKDAIVALAKYLGEELEIVEFERKNPLTLLNEPTKVEDVKANTAIIAFSRKDVLRLKQKFSQHFSVSVVYGNLSPEVRREEARRFRAGETQILVATDAIAMGMNLPIQTILFSKAEKFDGITQRNLVPSEVHQISGRAGRYGLHEEGFVGALDRDVLRIVKKNFHKEARKIDIPFKVMANLEHIKLVGNILEENSLYEILKFFIENMEFNGPFVASSLDDMLEAAQIVDNYDLDIATKYHLACAPLTLKSPYIVAAYESYLVALEKKMPIPYIAPHLNSSSAQTMEDLLRAEDMVKEISLYLWLSYRFKEYFIDEQKARRTRGMINRYIEESLQQSHLAARCKLCGKPLPLNYKYSICQSCFKKHYTRKNSRGYRKTRT